MNQDRIVTIQTKNKIKKLSHFHFRLWKDYANYKTLENIFLNLSIDNTRPLLFLKQKNLITNNNIITPLGLALIIAHNFSINLLSVFVLSKIFHYTIKTTPTSILPHPTLMSYFDSFSNKQTIRRVISNLKQKNILEFIGTKQLRLEKKTYEKLFKFKSPLISISIYIDEINEGIEELINNDSLVQETRTKNLRTWENTIQNV